jgi:hypothetical protein
MSSGMKILGCYGRLLVIIIGTSAFGVGFDRLNAVFGVFIELSVSNNKLYYQTHIIQITYN